ncbi:MAG: hypothetical protein ACREQ9_07715, partial [Candidatus Binatia bacterium]
MTRTLPSPRRVTHHRTLWWWMAGLAAAVLVRFGQGYYFEPKRAVMAELPRIEREAFVAFVFGKVSDRDPLAIPPARLHAQLLRLKNAGYHPVRLEDVRRFYERSEPLPEKPVLVAFEEARRETVEAVDPILASLGMPATAFVNVDALRQGSLDLVSRHHVDAMVASGQWSVGVGACLEASAANAGPEHAFPVDQYRRQRAALEAWSGEPVAAIHCPRSFGQIPEAEERWSAALRQVSIPLGFVARVPGANYRDDPPSRLRLVRVTAGENDPDALVRRLAAFTPRRERFVDDFDGGALQGAWLTDWGEARVERGELRITKDPATSGGMVWLGGSERWGDARAEVALAGQPTGEFWLYLRR